MTDTRFVNNKPLTFDCDLDFGCENLNFVRDTPAYFALSFCQVLLNSLYRFLSNG